MLKFLLGVIAGALLSFGYVRYNVQLPEILQLGDRLRGNLISTAVEQDLYNLERPTETHRRALEVFFANRPADAAAIDARNGYPFLQRLHSRRAIRQARILSMQWSAFDAALSRPELRKVLERKHGTSSDVELKRAMLVDALDREPFLKQWLITQGEQINPQTLQDVLKKYRALAPPGSADN